MLWLICTFATVKTKVQFWKHLMFWFSWFFFVLNKIGVQRHHKFQLCWHLSLSVLIFLISKLALINCFYNKKPKQTLLNQFFFFFSVLKNRKLFLKMTIKQPLGHFLSSVSLHLCLFIVYFLYKYFNKIFSSVSMRAFLVYFIST